MLPWLGVYQSSLVIGAINLTIVMVLLNAYQQDLTQHQVSRIKLYLTAVASALSLALVFSQQLLHIWDQNL